MKPLAEQPEQEWLALVEDLLAQAEAAPAAGERAVLLCRVADVYDRRIGDADSALVTLRAALDQEPGSGRVAQDLERFARTSGRWDEVIGAVLAKAESLADAKLAADLRVQIAFWHEVGLGDPDGAAASARAALELAPGHGGALALLEELYRRQQRWELYVEIQSQKWGDPYRDHYKIAEAYREVLRYEPKHRGALEGLARLHEAASQWEAAVETLRRLREVVPEEDRATLHHRTGLLLLERVGDARAAEAELLLGLALPVADPQAQVPTMLALAGIYRARGDWLKARQLLGRAADASADPAAKIGLLFEAAEICREKLDDGPQAAELYAAVLALDPGHPGVAEPLAAILFRRGEWTALLPVAEKLAADADEAKRDGATRAVLHHRIGRAREALGEEERAAEAYGQAFEADPTHVPTLRDAGALAFKRQAFATAARLYEQLLVVHAADLRRDETLEALERLGVSLLRSGDPARAVPALERALALDGRRRAVLEALCDAAAAAGDDEALIRHTQALLPLTDHPDAKLALTERLAEIHRSRRNDPQRAIAAYMAALEIKPDARPLMHRLLELLTETKQWKQAVQVLLRLADLEDAGPVRARALVAAANVLHYELHADADAVDLYDRALDADPEHLEAFERLDKVVTALRDWKTQERCYRRQLKRMGTDVAPEKRAALLALWMGLGEIYRTRLKDVPSAVAAFEVAAGLEGDPDRRAEIARVLAELYPLAGPPGYAKAVREHRLLMRHAPDARAMAPSLHMLVRLFVESGELDHAFCAAGVLALAGQATADERALYDQYRPAAPRRAARRMTEELWQAHLYHAEQDRLLSQMLAVVGAAVASARAKPHKDWGLKRKQRRDVAADPSIFCRALAYASGVLGVPWPEVYLAPEAPGEVDLANARDGVALTPAFVVGRGALEGRSELELAYVVARHLTMLRPDCFLRWPAVVPTLAELEVVARAALALAAPDTPVPDEAAEGVARYAQFLEQQLAPQQREQLGLVGRRFAASGAPLDLPRWARAVTLTSVRAGLLLCGDLEVASRLGQVQAAAAAIDPGDVTRDLAEWSVSDGYFTLRAELGLGAVNVEVALR